MADMDNHSRGKVAHRHRRIARHRPRDRARARRRGRAGRGHRASDAHLSAARPQIESAGPARSRRCRPTCAATRTSSAPIAATVGAVRRPRHPRQQRRRRHLRQRRRHDARAVVRGHRHEPHRRVQRLPRGASRTCAGAAAASSSTSAAWPARTPSPTAPAYCASKAGLNAFSEALMQEVRYDNIRVSYVMPGSVATGFARRRSSRRAPTGRSPPDEVAEVVVNLLRHPARSLPSRVELRPSKPPKK